MEPVGKITSAKLLKVWWPGTELNRRRQPFQGCSRPSLSSCNPYLYCRSDPHFGVNYWTHNGPNNLTHVDSGVRLDTNHKIQGRRIPHTPANRRRGSS